MRKLITFCLILGAGAAALLWSAPSVPTPSNTGVGINSSGVVVAPANFFPANSNAINAVVSLDGRSVPSLYVNTLTVTNQFPTNSFSGPTNGIALNNSYQLYTAAGNMGISGVSNTLSSGSKWTTLFVTNSTGGNITNYITAGRPIGPGTTNILTIPSGKIGVISFVAYGTMFTNYTTAVQQ